MTVSLKHNFVSAVADGADTSLVRPSNWNAEHTLTLAAGKVLGRDTSSSGAAQELPIAVDSSGNVGIGTSSPGQRLQISNTSSSGFAAIRMAADSRSYDVGVGGSASGFQQNNWYIYDATASAIRFNIASGGNVGIGTASPSYKLSLEDSGNFAIHLLKTSSNDGWIRNIGNLDIAAASGGSGGQNITFSTGANYAGLTEAMRIDGVQNVGIGTTSPGAPLDVVTRATSGAGVRVRQASGNTTDAILQFTDNPVTKQLGTLTFSNSGTATLNSLLGNLVLTDFNTKSFGTNGYQKLPGGLIIQWGNFQSTDTSTTTVTFPVAFPSGIGAVTGLQYGTGGADQYANGWRMSAIGTTSFSVKNSTNATTNLYWIAVGW